ncbi:MAG: hypothetical protein ACC628_11655, partial [Pirellulaceae bacterium]
IVEVGVLPSQINNRQSSITIQFSANLRLLAQQNSKASTTKWTSPPHPCSATGLVVGGFTTMT